MDLKWQMAMLTIRSRRFLKQTRRKVGANGSETIRATKENMNIEPVKRNVTVETIDANALVAQDRLENFMPPKPDLILVDMDEYVVSEFVTSVPTSESKPKSVSEPIIEDWVCNSEDENETETKSKQRKPSFAKYEEIAGGYVAFRGDPKGGKIIGKGKISTDTECVVLSPGFKLLDDSQVLLRVSRKNNMYNVDLKNVAPLR
nr:hypothetical protein [Tanacetum cinerariifolium]